MAIQCLLGLGALSASMSKKADIAARINDSLSFFTTQMPAIDN
jgi:hypothetical protein